MRWYTLLDLVVLLSIVATKLGAVLPKQDECPLVGISVPACPVHDPEFSVFFPHPSDCHWFFHCSNSVAYCKKCPADLHWNSKLETCDFPIRAGCEEENSTSTSPTDKPGSEPPTPTFTTTPEGPGEGTSPTVGTEVPSECPEGESPKCPYPDGEYSVFFPHPNDCHWFFHCSNGVAYCKKCPADLHWNNKLETCDFPFRAGCEEENSTSTSPTYKPGTEPPTPTFTTPEGPGEGTSPIVGTELPSECPEGEIPKCPYPDGEYSVFFPHPNDCHWFFHCSNGVAYCKKCPADLHWNNKLETCDFPFSAGCEEANSTSTSPTDKPGSEPPTPTFTTTPEGPGEGTSPTVGTEFPSECPEGESPKCPYPDGDYSVFFPHPNDCHWFFHCSNGVAYCKKCPADLHWNNKLETCDFPFRAGCEEANSTSTSPTDKPGTEPPTPTFTTTPEGPGEGTSSTVGTEVPTECPEGEIPKCPYPDGDYSVFFPHPNDCNWFFHCSNGVAYCKNCPADLHWNNKLETCDFPFRAGCNETDSTTTSSTSEPGPELPNLGVTEVCPDGPLPECPYPDGEYSVFFPHPNDSHWFFHCSNGVAYCKKCPADLHWNNKLETCDFGLTAA